MTTDACSPSSYTVIVDAARAAECCVCVGDQGRVDKACFACNGTGVDADAKTTCHFGPFPTMNAAQQAARDAQQEFGPATSFKIVSNKDVPQGDLLLEKARKMTCEQIVEHTQKSAEHQHEAGKKRGKA